MIINNGSRRTMEQHASQKARELALIDKEKEAFVTGACWGAKQKLEEYETSQIMVHVIWFVIVLGVAVVGIGVWMTS